MMIYVIRHAWAYDRDERWPDDDLRPLTPEGIDRFTRQLKAIDRKAFAPQVILSSPLVRCRQTAELVQKRAGDEVRLSLIEALAPGSNLEAALAATLRLELDRVAWVGHAPDVSWLSAKLMSDGSAAIHFGKGQMAAIEFHGPPQPGTGELRWLVSAKLWGI